MGSTVTIVTEEILDGVNSILKIILEITAVDRLSVWVSEYNK
ncbi:hypothetical protein [Gillisia sp. JM1]|nr:hypothetical protein [Gillisia sp. JM1]